MGNTNTRLVRFAGDEVVSDQRCSTAALREGSPAPGVEKGLGIAMVSVVPAVAERLATVWRDHELVMVRAETALGLTIAYEPPTAIGADRLANAFLAFRRFGSGLVIDFGTATTLTLVGDGGVLLGGAIMPGLATAMASLNLRTAQLPEVEVAVPRHPWGRSTAESIQVGVVQGHAGAVMHLARQFGAERVVCTGGWAMTMAELLPAGWLVDVNWTVRGAREVYLCNTRGCGI